jgi:hypothetical protein
LFNELRGSAAEAAPFAAVSPKVRTPAATIRKTLQVLFMIALLFKG